MKETPSKHIFSKHDNRHAFPGSATYFEHGLGRRRIDGSLPNTQTLIDWIPLKEELERERPLLSSYQFDFHSKGKVPQVLIHHRQLQQQLLQRIPSTTYQHTYRSYCLYEPNLRIFKEQQVAELKEPETTVPTSSEPSTLASGEPPVPAPASSEPAATETRTAAEAVAPAPVSGRSVFHLPPRLTVSDCLHWHNC